MTSNEFSISQNHELSLFETPVSIASNDVPYKETNSPMKHYFKMTIANSICNYCGKVYTSKTSTGTLKTHLKEKHPNIFCDIKHIPVNINPYNKKERTIYHISLIHWIILSQQPFSVVDEKSFIELIHQLNPRYHVPTRQFVKRYIKQLFEFRLRNLSIDLKKITSKVALTADMWTSINNCAFLGVTLHWIDNDWCLRRFLLDIIPFHRSHSGANMANELLALLRRHGILEKTIALTTDNASSMVVCGRKLAESLNQEFQELHFSHYRCGAHIINLAVQSGLQLHDSVLTKVRKFMKKVKKSTILTDDLRRIFEASGRNYLAPEIDVSTRWNSTFLMIDKLNRIKIQADMLVAQHPELQEIYPTNTEWKNLKVPYFNN
jgi:hypothetical protein